MRLASLGADNCFTSLESLNLAYNYIGDEEELLPAVLIDKLTRLIVYGNPLCGFSGEDPSGQCVARAVESAIEARDGWGEHELLVITEKPTNGNAKKDKNATQGSSRRSNLYRDIHLSQVIDDTIPTAAQFRMAGNKQLNVLNVAGSHVQTARVGHQQQQQQQQQQVSERSARGETKIRLTTKLTLFRPAQYELRDEAGNGSSAFVTGVDIEDDQDEQRFQVEDGFFDQTGGLVVPSSLLQTSFSKGKNNADGSKLHAAISALRHALKGADDKGDALKINDPRTGINRPNAAYLARALPKRHVRDADGNVIKEGGGDEGDKDKDKDTDKERQRNQLRAVTPGIKNAKKNAKDSGKAALHQLEDMLDQMNDRMADIEAASGHDGRARTAGIASRSGDRAIGELVSMVDVVVDRMAV